MDILGDGGLIFVKDFFNLLDEDFKDYAMEMKEISAKELKKWRTQVRQATFGDPPVVVNYKNADNQYKAKYGANWWQEIEKVISMSPFICIT